jgi:hypothetical protein
MKKRGLASPDDGDALACTFAYPVGEVALKPYKAPRYRGPGSWMAA